MNKGSLLVVMSFWIFSCSENKVRKLSREVTIENTLVISVPNNIKFVEGKGIDSYVAFLITPKMDTIQIEYGNKGVIQNFPNPSPVIFSLSQKETILKTANKEPTSEEVVFSEYPEEDREQKIFDKNYYMYDTIGGLVVKLVQPKKIGIGVTGLYVPRLKDGKSFIIYGENLDSGMHVSMLQILETLKYK